MIVTIAPGPILFSMINFALFPVAFDIVTPDSLTGSINIVGFRAPHLLIFQDTSITLVLADSPCILNANAYFGLSFLFLV